MNQNQINACQNRNEQLKQAIEAGDPVTIAAVKRACIDIDNLLSALETMTNRARIEQEAQLKLRQDLAIEKKLKADCMRTVSILRDKLSKARKILVQLDPNTLTRDERRDMKDIIKEA